MLRIVGGILILSGATALGYTKTRQYYTHVSQLREFRRGMELVRCQMNYTLYSIPKLLSIVGSRLKGPPGAYFIHLSEAITRGTPRHRAHEEALRTTRGLSLPRDGLLSLIEWSGSLGQFDPEGENRMMLLSIQRMERALTAYEEDKKQMVKSYTILGACAGIAMIILML